MNQTKPNQMKPASQQNPSSTPDKCGSSKKVRRQREPRKPTCLRFTPTAWAKWLFLRDQSDDEVGAFGVADPNDLLLVRRVVTVKQTVTPVTVKFDDTAVADFFENMVDAGLRPEQFGRIWLHTHPGNSPTPSNVDEDTFADAFGKCQWSVMAILARDDSTYARLQFGVGPGCQISIPVKVDYSQPFEASDHAGWTAEYKANVTVEDWRTNHARVAATQAAARGFFGDDKDWPDAAILCSKLPPDFDRLPPSQQLLILEELGICAGSSLEEEASGKGRQPNGWLNDEYDGDRFFFDEDRINDPRNAERKEPYGA